MNIVIVLFTDFGIEGPYLGQLKAAIYQKLPRCIVVDLFSDLPPFQARAAASLLAAYSNDLPAGSVFLCVVDPGVGTVSRRAVVVEAKGSWFVGPDNGLFDLLLLEDEEAKCWQIAWQPPALSNTFHGRDLFAPIAIELESGVFPRDKLTPLEQTLQGRETRVDYPHVVYIDRFGNLVTGLRSLSISPDVTLGLKGEVISYATTYGEVEEGALFWYKNSSGLIEIAANSASAKSLLKALVGDLLSY